METTANILYLKTPETKKIIINKKRAIGILIYFLEILTFLFETFWYLKFSTLSFKTNKTTKTIFLYKKGNANDPSAWRPIGLTSTLHRLFTGTIARSINSLQNKINIFSLAI